MGRSVLLGEVPTSISHYREPVSPPMRYCSIHHGHLNSPSDGAEGPGESAIIDLEF